MVVLAGNSTKLISLGDEVMLWHHVGRLTASRPLCTFLRVLRRPTKLTLCSCALEHGLKHLLILREVVEFPRVAVRLQHHLHLLLRVHLWVQLEVPQQIDQLGIDLSRLTATPFWTPFPTRHLENALDRTRVVSSLPSGGRLVREEVVVELDDLGFWSGMGVEDFEGGLVGDLTSMGIVATQDVVDAVGMGFSLEGVASWLDDGFYLGESQGEGVGEKFLSRHQLLTQ